MPGVDLNYFMRQANKLTEKIEERKQQLAEETVQGQAGDGRVTVVANGVQEVKSIKVDPALVDPTDIAMLEMDGLEFQEHLTTAGIHVPVIVMTGHADVPLAVKAMKAGAVDFIEKPFGDETILASIEGALKRKPRVTDPALAERLASLTPREREVLELLVIGHPNKVIAHRLDISPRTVEIHRAHVMEKMKAKSLPELVRSAMQAGVSPQV